MVVLGAVLSGDRRVKMLAEEGRAELQNATLLMACRQNFTSICGEQERS